MSDILFESLAEAVEGDVDLDLLMEELIEGNFREQTEAVARQKRIAEASDRIDRGFIDGVGQMTMRVDLTAYLLWQHNHPGCWGDRQFRREFMRDNPEVRVKSKSRKIGLVAR